MYSMVAATASLLLLFMPIAAVAVEQADSEYYRGIMFFRDSVSNVVFPTNVNGIVFDATADFAADSATGMQWAWLGPIRVHSVIYEDTVMELNSPSQLTGISVGPEMLAALADIRSRRLIREFSSFRPEDTLTWDCVLGRWRHEPNSALWFEIHFSTSILMDSALERVKAVPYIFGPGGIPVPTVDGWMESPVDPPDTHP